MGRSVPTIGCMAATAELLDGLEFPRYRCADIRRLRLKAEALERELSQATDPEIRDELNRQIREATALADELDSIL